MHTLLLKTISGGCLNCGRGLMCFNLTTLVIRNLLWLVINMNNIRVFIGYDFRESLAFHVFSDSINRHSSVPVSITPIRLSQLNGVMWRDRDPKQSNDFSFSRWSVPFLCNYEGWAIFADCDMLCREDINEVWKLRDPTKAVQVVKHNYVPKTEQKYLGNIQYKYEKKNWSSFILFNCSHPDCKKLTQTYINSAHGLDLHQFKWVSSPNLIGELPKEWNHLVGEYDYNPDASNVHYTIIGPWDRGCNIEDYREEWEMACSHMQNADETKVTL